MRGCPCVVIEGAPNFARRVTKKERRWMTFIVIGTGFQEAVGTYGVAKCHRTDKVNNNREEQ
jgi:hypothetical protein